MSRGVLKCPRCSGSDGLRHSHPRWFDALFRALALKAYRCRHCRKRFYSMKPLPVIVERPQVE
jgi:hypothetical protein